MCARSFDLLLPFHFVQLLDENAQLIRVSEAGYNIANFKPLPCMDVRMLDNYVQQKREYWTKLSVNFCVHTHIVYIYAHTIPSQVLVENMNSKGKATECIQ